MGNDIVFAKYLTYKNFNAFMENVTPPSSLRAFHNDYVTQTRIIAQALKQVSDQRKMSEPFIERNKFADKIDQCRDAMNEMKALQQGIKHIYDRVLDGLKQENDRLEAKEKQKYDFSK